MTDTPNRPPLWREMCRAMAEVEMGACATKMYAAEIRALRDWLVPEEKPPLGPAGKAHMELRALLTTEAARAERSDD